jgi:hypothetical protein
MRTHVKMDRFVECLTTRKKIVNDWTPFTETGTYIDCEIIRIMYENHTSVWHIQSYRLLLNMDVQV